MVKGAFALGQHQRITHLIAVLLGIFVAHSANAESNGWEHLYEDDGINVYRQTIEGTSLLAFRGTGTIDAPVEDVLFVFTDVTREVQWVDRLLENKLLQENRDTFSRIEFHSYGLPWPVWSRDIVFEIKLRKRRQAGYLVSMKSVDDALGPPTKGVRATLHGSNFILTPREDGRTDIEVDIFIDPKGRVPAFLVNILQRYWPYNTITGLQRQVRKPFVKAFSGNPPIVEATTSAQP